MEYIVQTDVAIPKHNVLRLDRKSSAHATNKHIVSHNKTSMDSQKHHFLLNNSFCKLFGKHFLKPDLWQINQRSVSGAVFWGLLCSFLILPIQFIPATLGALLFRINLPITILMTWFSNPFTILPILYVAYWIGTLLFAVPMISLHDFAIVADYVQAMLSNGNTPQMPASIVHFSFGALLSGLLIQALMVSGFALLCVKLLWGNAFLSRFFAKLLHKLSIGLHKIDEQPTDYTALSGEPTATATTATIRQTA